MPSLDAAIGHRRPDRRYRLVVGFGLFVAGTVLVGLGVAGATDAQSVPSGVFTGGLAALGGLFVLAVRAPLSEPERTSAAVGVAVGLASLLFLWGMAPADQPIVASVGVVVGVLGYLVGSAVVLAAVLSAVTSRQTRQSIPSRSVRWRRRESAVDDSPTADGGSSGDDIALPVEED